MIVTLDEKSSGRGTPSRRKAPGLGEETLDQSRNRLDAGRWSSAFEALRPEAAQGRAVQPGSCLVGSMRVGGTGSCRPRQEPGCNLDGG